MRVRCAAGFVKLLTTLAGASCTSVLMLSVWLPVFVGAGVWAGVGGGTHTDQHMTDGVLLWPVQTHGK